MEYTQRNTRHSAQTEGGRGSLDGRIGGGLSEFARGKQYVGRSRRDEPLSYDDKPMSRNFEGRLNVDNRTLEDRITVATPTSVKKFGHNYTNDGTAYNKLANQNQSKQGKKVQNKVQKQANRVRESVMLTEPQLQEETVGTLIRNSGSVKTTVLPAAMLSDDAGQEQISPQKVQSVIRPGGEADVPREKKSLHLDVTSESHASIPSPVTASLQEQLREKALASMKKKVQSDSREKDGVSTNTEKAKQIPPETAPAQTHSTGSPGEQSALFALEQRLNSPLAKRTIDPERDAAVDAMLAEVQASSEVKKPSQQGLVKAEKNCKLLEELDSNMGPSSVAHSADKDIPKQLPASTAAKTPETHNKGPRSLADGSRIEKSTRGKDTDSLKERSVQAVAEGGEQAPIGESASKLEAQQKLTNLPPLQSSSLTSHASTGRPQYHNDRYRDEENDTYRKENADSSVQKRTNSSNITKHIRDVGEDLERSDVDRRQRFYDQRVDTAEHERRRVGDDARRRAEKQIARPYLKGPYREDNHRFDSIRGGETREHYYSAHRLSSLLSPARPLLPEEFNYAQDYQPYGAVRYLPIREEEHLGRQPDYDPYYKDLAEWLEITGFHDIDYRQAALRRHRERELDRLYALRAAAASAAARGEDVPSPIERRMRNGSGLMPPPQVPTRVERGIPPETSIRVAPDLQSYPSKPALPHPPPATTHAVTPSVRPDERSSAGRYKGVYRATSPAPVGVGLKRRISHDDIDERRPEKTCRTLYETQTHKPSPRPEEELDEYRGNRPGASDVAVQDSRIFELKEHGEGNSHDYRGAARPVTPVREIHEKLAARSPNSNRYYDNESRKSTYKESGSMKGRTLDDDQTSIQSSRPGKRPYGKADRRVVTPVSSPKMEKAYYKGGRLNNHGKYHQHRDDHRPPLSGYDYGDGFRSPGHNNFGRRRVDCDNPRRKSSYGHGGDYGRDWFNRTERKEKPFVNKATTGLDNMEAASSNGAINTDTRYFIVKSFNHDNVLHAQRDGIWATQEKNAEIFSEAFRTARDVILIFSVNKSGKFQGYARMESAPGTAEMPTWTKGLLWKSSGAFYIRWITICDISFYHLSSLLNRLNEDQPVFVGRDGQEIDPETGAQLCNIVDESRVH